MGTTGLIFGAIAIAWLAYLVPHFVRRREDDPVDEQRPEDRFSHSMRVVRHGTAPLLDQDLTEIGAYEVSTPTTRRAAISDLRRLERLAARRRRRVLVTLMLALTAVLVVATLGWVPWWATAIPGGVVLAFLVVARFSVRALRRSLDRRYELIRRGGAEVTVLINRGSVTPEEVAAADPAPGKASAGALWDPVPITMPTYVSKPLAPRTVRTIDIAGPSPAANANGLPVTADARPAAGAAEPGQTGHGSSEAASA